MKVLNFVEVSSQSSKYWSKAYQNKIKINNSLKSDNSQKMQKNIYKQHQLSAQCVQNINHLHGSVYSVKKFHVKIVFLLEIIVKETIEVPQ